MKPYYEAYMSDMHRKRTQRRRIVSMLLVLSVFVTSGVSWALRGVGLTMVNEAECGWEEHIHTDDCYERQLICGLEEDASHTHTDACWADVLVCGCEEHIHDAQCYGGSSSGLFSAKKIALEDARSDAEGIAEYDDTEDFYEDADEEDSDADAASLRAAAPSGQLRAAGESTVPNTVETVDNIARGIKITLFDYGDSVLEGKDNNYGYARDDSFNVIVPYRHDNIKDSGINTGRYPEIPLRKMQRRSGVRHAVQRSVLRTGRKISDHSV